MIRAYRTELKPNREQEATFRRWAGSARYIYNWALAERIKAYQEEGKTLTQYGQDKVLTQLKREPDHEWLSETPRRVLYYALEGLDGAYKAFFRRVKSGEGAPGFPRFKSKGRSRMAFTVHGSDIAIDEKRIRLPKLGWVRLKEKDYLPTWGARLMECTVSERAGRWFVSVTVELVGDRGGDGAPMSPATGPVLAAHPGVRTFLTIRNEAGEEERIGNRRALEMGQARLRRLQRRLARQTKGGANREKTKKLIARTHARISNQRSDATHKATHRATHGLRPEKIVVQQWRVRDMMEQKTRLPKWLERKIRRQIADANMAETIRQLTYKAGWAGSHLVELPPEVAVSRTCSNCGVVKSDLGMEQIFKCDACGHVIDRETNAAINLLSSLQSAVVDS